MILNPAGGDNWKKTLPAFSYTGQYEFVNDGISGGMQHWRLRLLSSGTLTFAELGSGRKGVDVFCVGGGGAGGLYNERSTGGGGGGYTSTTRGYPAKRTQYAVVVGAGGQAAWGVGGRGGTSSISALGASAAGGYGGGANEYDGGNGGSGGGGAGYWSAKGYGGSDGGDGSMFNPGAAGKGQGRTTREFGQSGAALYAGGGGNGVTWEVDRTYDRSPGGAGGGGAGGLFSPIEATDFTLEAYPGTANTGGGGGGCGMNAQDLTYAGAGGSGIVIIRNAR